MNLFDDIELEINVNGIAEVKFVRELAYTDKDGGIISYILKHKYGSIIGTQFYSKDKPNVILKGTKCTVLGTLRQNRYKVSDTEWKDKGNEIIIEKIEALGGTE